MLFRCLEETVEVGCVQPSVCVGGYIENMHLMVYFSHLKESKDVSSVGQKGMWGVGRGSGMKVALVAPFHPSPPAVLTI